MRELARNERGVRVEEQCVSNEGGERNSPYFVWLLLAAAAASGVVCCLMMSSAR
jgi:hypothetical protein